VAGQIFFWRTSCFIFFVARKYQVRALGVAAMAEASVANLRLSKGQTAAAAFSARVKKLPSPRRRLPVAVFYEPVTTVKIRHIGSNLGSVLGETQPVQNQRI
jgi:hypothetical protein